MVQGLLVEYLFEFPQQNNVIFENIESKHKSFVRFEKIHTLIKNFRVISQKVNLIFFPFKNLFLFREFFVFFSDHANSRPDIVFPISLIHTFAEARCILALDNLTRLELFAIQDL